MSGESEGAIGHLALIAPITKPQTVSARLHLAVRRVRHVRLPRLLLLWWSLWLLASWFTAFGWRWWIQPSIATYITAAQRMMLSVMLGITIVWPMYRLVLRPSHTPRLLPLVDWLAIFATLQVLLWPMRVPTQWSAMDVLLIDAAIFAWGWLYSGLIGLGMLDSARRHRAAVMILCVLVAAAGPAMAGFTASIDSLTSSAWLNWSPITSVWLHVGRNSITIEAAAWWRLATVGAAALLLWLAVVLWPARARHAVGPKPLAG